jgi:hypothetical protein
MDDAASGSLEAEAVSRQKLDGSDGEEAGVMLTCKSASHLISAGEERRLGRRERLALAWHLLLCSACRRFARHMAWMRRGMNALHNHFEHGDVAPDVLPPEKRERIRRAVQRHFERDQ